MSIFGKIILILVLLIIMAVFAILNLLCYQYTKTTNIRQFFLDPTYWCFATVNYEFSNYENAKDRMPEFVEYFLSSYLFGTTIFHRILVTEQKKQLLSLMLNNPDFIKENFGIMPYNTKANNTLVTKWNALFEERAETEEEYMDNE